MSRHLETDTLTNQDISSATAIGAYTSDGDRLVVAQFFADQVAGNGDYIFYATLQIAGAGSSYRFIPITTAAAASGLTAIAGQSITVAMRNTDVLTVYLDGLAGDTTTPDTTVRFFEYAALQPATADRTLLVDASGQTTVGALATTALVDMVANDSGETAAASGSVAKLAQADISGLTAAITDNTASGNTIIQYRGDGWSISRTGLGSVSGKSNSHFAIKYRTSDADTEALLLVDETTGLIYINQAAAGTAANASITWDDQVAGDYTVAVAGVETAKLPAIGDLVFSMEIIGLTQTPKTVDQGQFDILGDVIKATATITP